MTDCGFIAIRTGMAASIVASGLILSPVGLLYFFLLKLVKTRETAEAKRA